MVLVFNLLTLACCAYALIRGGAPERVAATIALLGLAGAWASLLIGFRGFAAVKVDILIQDIAIFVALQAVALYADRFWPMWLAGLQLAIVLVHLTRAIEPNILPFAYAVGLWCWAYLMLGVLVIGTWRHGQRVRTGGPEHGWSHQRRRAGIS